MSLPQKYYLEHVFNNTKYRANWLPDKPLRIGDIGKLENGLFTLYTTLEMEQIKCAVRDSVSELAFDYSSKNTVIITPSVDTGNALGLALNTPVKGKVTINFTESNGVVLQMTGSKIRVIENLAEIEKIILEKFRNKDWPKEWVIISELVITDNATIIISTSSNNQIELGCSAHLSLGNNNLADPKLGLTLISEKGSSTKIFGASGLTPFYQVKGVYKPFLSTPKFRTRGEDPTVNSNKLSELKFNPEELL
jgi:hypothetical protein